jgi:hypothetical protein
MRGHEFDVGYWLLDDQIVDSEGGRCGRVDDVEFEGGPGKPATMVAIRTGPGAARRRFPSRLRWLGRLFPDVEVRVPWSEVAEIDVVVELKKPARDYGLGAGDRQARKLVERIPGAEL